MASSESALLKLELQTDGENDSTWGSKTNTNLQLLEQAAHGLSSVAVTASNVTLTDTAYATNEARKLYINVTGALTGNRSVIVPARTHLYMVFNNTTGAYDLTVTTSGGTGIIVPQGQRTILWCDGTNVVTAIDAIDSDNAPNIIANR